jgi:hypothetical protein
MLVAEIGPLEAVLSSLKDGMAGDGASLSYEQERGKLPVNKHQVHRS